MSGRVSCRYFVVLCFFTARNRGGAQCLICVYKNRPGLPLPKNWMRRVMARKLTLRWHHLNPSSLPIPPRPQIWAAGLPVAILFPLIFTRRGNRGGA